MLMPFGKFKGDSVFELPDSYLIWLRDNIELREPLKTHVFNELETRGLLPDHKLTAGGLDLGRIKAVYRDLSLMFHPDRGGNTEAMKAINLFYERVKELAD